MDEPELRVLTETEAVALRLLCERIVPGSAQTGAVDYIDRLAYAMPTDGLRRVRTAISELVRAVADDDRFESTVGSPSFALLRALVIEAYYGDYARDDYEGQTGWQAIGFAPPRAPVGRKDWSFLDRRWPA